MKAADIKPFREKIHKKQRGVCCLCNRYIRKEDAALDHCHTTGKVRGVLHKNCNSIEGRILHWARRSGIRPDIFLRRLTEYWDQDYTNNPVHPRHKNETEKEVTRLRRRIRRAKRERTKQRLRDEIKRLRGEQRD